MFSGMSSADRAVIALFLGGGLLLATTIISVTYIVQSNSKTGYEAIERLIAQGHDPIAARCAIWGRSSESDISCSLKAAQQKPVAAPQP